ASPARPLGPPAGAPAAPSPSFPPPRFPAPPRPPRAAFGGGPGGATGGKLANDRLMHQRNAHRPGEHLREIERRLALATEYGDGRHLLALFGLLLLLRPRLLHALAHDEQPSRRARDRAPQENQVLL